MTGLIVGRGDGGVDGAPLGLRRPVHNALAADVTIGIPGALVMSLVLAAVTRLASRGCWRSREHALSALRRMVDRPMASERMNIVIAGGGVAGLEALLGLHDMAGERVRLTLIAPQPDFSYRPMAVAEPFALGHAHRVPLKRFAEEAGAELVQDAVIGVDDAAREVRLRDGGARPYDALPVAPGGRAWPA